MAPVSKSYVSWSPLVALTTVILLIMLIIDVDRFGAKCLNLQFNGNKILESNQPSILNRALAPAVNNENHRDPNPELVDNRIKTLNRIRRYITAPASAAVAHNENDNQFKDPQSQQQQQHHQGQHPSLSNLGLLPSQQWTKLLTKLFIDIQLLQNELGELKQSLNNNRNQIQIQSAGESNGYPYGQISMGPMNPSMAPSSTNHYHYHYYYPMVPMVQRSEMLPLPPTPFDLNPSLGPYGPKSSNSYFNPNHYYRPHLQSYSNTAHRHPHIPFQPQPYHRNVYPYLEMPGSQPRFLTRPTLPLNVSTQVPVEIFMDRWNNHTAPSTATTNQTDNNFNVDQTENSGGDSSDILKLTSAPSTLSTVNNPQLVELTTSMVTSDNDLTVVPSTYNVLTPLNNANFVMASCEMIANRHITLLNQQDISGHIRMWQQRPGFVKNLEPTTNGAQPLEPVFMQIRLKGFKVFEDGDKDGNEDNSQNHSENQVEFYNNDPATTKSNENLVPQSEPDSNLLRYPVEHVAITKPKKKRQTQPDPTTLAELESNFVRPSFDLIDLVPSSETRNQSPVPNNLNGGQTLTGRKSNQFLFGMHVHELSDMSRDCQSTGGHYNPFNVTHGGPNDLVKHVGDLGNLLCNAQGEVNLNLRFEHLNLLGEQGIINRSIVIRNQPDDYGKSRKNKISLVKGNSGARIACCVIREIEDEDQLQQHNSQPQSTNLTKLQMSE